MSKVKAEESEVPVDEGAIVASSESHVSMDESKDDVSKQQTSIPLLKLPAKVYASTIAQLKEEKPKRSPGSDRPSSSTRPTQVPPLVFPLNNIFDERPPLPISGHNPNSFYATSDGNNSTAPSATPSWDPSDSASYVPPPLFLSLFAFHSTATLSFVFEVTETTHDKEPPRARKNGVPSSLSLSPAFLSPSSSLAQANPPPRSFLPHALCASARLLPHLPSEHYHYTQHNATLDHSTHAAQRATTNRVA